MGCQTEVWHNRFHNSSFIIFCFCIFNIQMSFSPTTVTLPNHIAIIMDGNGRWAKKRNLPRVAGHKAGAKALKKTIKACVEKKIKALTVWAFGIENWGRPPEEVTYIMDLMLTTLKNTSEDLHKNNIRLRIIGDKARLNSHLQEIIKQAESLTRNNTGLNLTIAISYSGQWDLTQAIQQIAIEIEAKKLQAIDVTPALIRSKLCLADLPDPDLFIRTSGEIRISNYFLWQLAYTELYFTEVFWPDFNADELEKALLVFAKRERRYGLI